jgi:valyl-tRNA synthetase
MVDPYAQTIRETVRSGKFDNTEVDIDKTILRTIKQPRRYPQPTGPLPNNTLENVLKNTRDHLADYTTILGWMLKVQNPRLLKEGDRDPAILLTRFPAEMQFGPVENLRKAIKKILSEKRTIRKAEKKLEKYSEKIAKEVLTGQKEDVEKVEEDLDEVVESLEPLDEAKGFLKDYAAHLERMKDRKKLKPPRDIAETIRKIGLVLENLRELSAKIASA